MADKSTKTVEVVLKVVDQAGKNIQAASASLKKFSKEEKNAEKAAKNYNATQKKIASTTKEVGTSSTKAARGVKNLTGAELKASQASKKLATDAKKATSSIDKLGNQAVKTGNEVDTMSKDIMGGLGSMMADIGTIITTVASIGLPVVVFADFERKMAEVGAVASATGDQLDDLTQIAMELGSSTEFSARQVAEGMKFLSMAGFTVAETSEAIAGVLDLALVGTLELGQAADIATNILTGFGKETSELAEVNDVLVATFTNTNSTLSELGTALSYVGPIASGLGGDFNDLVAATGLLHNAGLKGTMAGTALRGVLAKLFNPTQEEAEQMAVLSDRLGGVGLQIQKTNGDFVGFESLLRQLEGAGITAAEALNLFGQRAGPGIAALLNQGSDAIGKMTETLDTSEGLAKALAEQMGDNLKGAMKQLTSASEGLLVRLGGDLAPAIESLVLSITGLLSSLNEWIDANPVLAGMIIKTAAAVATLVSAMAAFNLSKAFLTFAGIGWGQLSASIVGLIANMKNLGMVSMTVGATIKAAFGWVTVALLAITGVFAAGRWFYNIVSGNSAIQKELQETAKDARKAKEELKEFADFEPQKREEIVWFDKDEVLEYRAELEGAVKYQEAVLDELQAKAGARTFWTGAQTDEAKIASKALEGAYAKYRELENAVLAYNDAVNNGPTGNDMALQLSDTAISDIKEYKSVVGSLADEYGTLEKEASTAWKDIKKQADSSLSSQRSAIISWAGVYKTKFTELAHNSSSTFSKLKQDIISAMESTNDPNILNKLTSGLKDAARKGASAFQEMGDDIRTVLDEVAQKEQALISKIETYTNKILSIQERAASKRNSIEQESMTTAEKYYDNKRQAEENLAKAADLAAKATDLQGAAKEKALAASNKYNERALSLADKLQAAEKDGISVSQSRADRLALINQFEKQSIDNVEQLNTVAEKELKVWTDVKTEVEGLKTLIDQMAIQLNDGLQIDLRTDEAKTQLTELATNLQELAGGGFLVDFGSMEESLAKGTSDTEDMQKVIKKVGDTWTEVWVKAGTGAQDAKKIIEDEFKDLSGSNLNINFAITGSGSATLPISEKVQAVRDELAGLENLTLELDVDFGTVTEDIAMIGSEAVMATVNTNLLKDALSLLNSQLTELSDTVLQVSIQILHYDKLKAVIKDLKKLIDMAKKPIVITTKYVSTGAAPLKRALGGKIPGYGGGDRNPVLAEDGEWFIRKEAVKKYGDNFMSMINNMSLPRFQTGGAVGGNLANTVNVQSDQLANFGKVQIDTGKGTFPAIINKDVFSDLESQLFNAKRFAV